MRLNSFLAAALGQGQQRFQGAGPGLQPLCFWIESCTSPCQLLPLPCQLPDRQRDQHLAKEMCPAPLLDSSQYETTHHQQTLCDVFVAVDRIPGMRCMLAEHWSALVAVSAVDEAPPPITTDGY